LARGFARVHAEVGRGLTKSRIMRFTFTGSRLWGLWPEPTMAASLASSSSASAAPDLYARIASSTPWMTSARVLIRGSSFSSVA
jgi:hypothetical protein